MPYYFSPRVEVADEYGFNHGFPLAQQIGSGTNWLWMGDDWAIVWSPLPIIHPDVTLLCAGKTDTILPPGRTALGVISDGRNANTPLLDFLVDLLESPPVGVGKWPQFKAGIRSGRKRILLGPGLGKDFYSEQGQAPPNSIAYEDTFNRSNRSINGDTSSDTNFTWSELTTAGANIVTNVLSFNESVQETANILTSVACDSDNVYIEADYDLSDLVLSLIANWYLACNSTLTQGNHIQLSRHTSNPTAFQWRRIIDIASTNVIDGDTTDPAATANIRAEIDGGVCDVYLNGSASSFLSGNVQETQDATHRRTGLGNWNWNFGTINDTLFDNFLYGDLVAGSLSIPVARHHYEQLQRR